MPSTVSELLQLKILTVIIMHHLLPLELLPVRAYVDNCSVGGASCVLDDEGVVNYDYFANIPIIKYYDRNIVTGFKFKGFKFPYFKESVNLCIEAAHRCKNPFIGWDVAITENGPVLIEAKSCSQL